MTINLTETPSTGIMLKHFTKMLFKFVQYLAMSRSSPVVWRGEDGYTLAIVGNLITFLFHFMTANNVVEIIEPQEPMRYIRAELNTDATLAWRPADLRLRVRPQ